MSDLFSFIRHTQEKSIFNLKELPMKDFMFVFRSPSYEDLKLTPEQSQAAMQKWYNWIGQLSAKGQYVGGAPLLNEGKMVKGKSPVITDGPFAEGKELVGGYLIIKAGSLKEATELAFGDPDFDIEGSVEVREIVQMPM
ncbi:MAG TPA: YciI family protein [Puia sp.]